MDETTRLKELARQIQRSLREFHFTERERLLVEVILDYSLAAGRPAARIPRLEDFSTLTGISRGNVHSTLARLVAKGVLVTTADLYRILPWSDLNRWMIAPRVHRAKLEAKRAELEAANRRPKPGELFAPDPDLAEARAEVCQAPAPPPAEPWRHGLEALRAAVTAVPDSGTNPPRRRSRFGNKPRVDEDQKADFAGVLAVPESGTPSLNVQRLNASSKKQLNVERCPPVPDSGTEAELMACIGAVVGQEDMAFWGGDWRANWVRKHPRAVRSALGEFREKWRNGWRPANAGAALKDLTKRMIQ